MFERFTERARRVIVLAQEEARLIDHNYIGTEHILLGLIHEGEGVAAKALENLRISLDSVRHQVVEIIGRGSEAPTGHIPFTPRAKKVLELSFGESLKLGHNYIGTEHILLGLLGEGKGVGTQVLQKLGVELSQVRDSVIRLLSQKGMHTLQAQPETLLSKLEKTIVFGGGGLLAVDVGNTETTIGIWKDTELAGQWRLATRRERTRDEYMVELAALFALDGFDSSQLEGAVVASVVPSATAEIEAALHRLVSGRVLTLGPEMNLGLPISVANPKEVGADRVANAVAALAEHPAPVVVVDFGTATTFDVVNAEGAYVGGVIAPGLQVSMESLVQATAALRRVPLQPPPSVIGRSTVEAMQSGLLYGYAGLVDGLIQRVVEELGGDPALIATGGLAATVVPHCRLISKIDEFLTLKGLRLIYHRNS